MVEARGWGGGEWRRAGGGGGVRGCVYAEVAYF